jgi:hypothetical protein
MSDVFPIQNGMTLRDPLEFAIWKVQVNVVGLKPNRTQELLVYAADDNLLCKDKHYKEKHRSSIHCL